VSEENKRLVREITEVVWNRRGVDRLDEFYAPDLYRLPRSAPRSTRS
jgi:hypothetical protein